MQIQHSTLLSIICNKMHANHTENAIWYVNIHLQGLLSSCRVLLASCKVLLASNPILFFHTQKDRCAVFLLLGGSGGIRTHVPLRTTAFRVRLVMTTSIRFLILYSIKLPCRAEFRRHLEKYTTNPSAVQAKLIEKNLEKNF